MPRVAEFDDVDLQILAVAAADDDGETLDDLSDLIGIPLRDVRCRVKRMRRLRLVQPALVRRAARARQLRPDEWPAWRIGSFHVIALVRLLELEGPASIDGLALRATAYDYPAMVAEGRPAGAFKRVFQDALESGWITGPGHVLVARRGLDLVHGDPAAADRRRARQAALQAEREATAAWLRSFATA